LALLPLRHAVAPRTTAKPTHPPSPLVECVLRDGLKVKNKDCESVVAIHKAVDALLALATDPPTATRRTVGHILRACGPIWPSAFRLATLVHLHTNPSLGRFARLYAAIQGYNLDGVWVMKPTLGVPKPHSLGWVVIGAGCACCCCRCCRLSWWLSPMFSGAGHGCYLLFAVGDT